MSRRVAGGRNGTFHRSSADWHALPEELTATTWSKDRRLVKDCHDRLVKALRNFDPSRLANIAGKTGCKTYADLITGIVLHDTYLVGQIQLSHSNLPGLAQRLNLMWEFGARRQNYEISWPEPWIFDRPVSLGIDLHNTIRERLFDGDSSPDYRKTRRGGKGVINIKTTQRNGRVVGLLSVTDDDELMMITAKGIMLRTGLEAVREIGRSTQGVRLIRLDQGDSVVGMEQIAPEDSDDDSADVTK